MKKTRNAESVENRNKPSTKACKFDKPDVCQLCTESMEDVVDPMKCGHWFHLACVKKHFKPECPLCRAVLPIIVVGTRPKHAIEHTYEVNGGTLSHNENAEVYTISIGSDGWDVSCADGGCPQCNEHYCVCAELTDDDPGSDEENPYGDNWCYGCV